MKIKPPPYEGDRKRLGKLIRDARGNRTLKEFGEATGVSYATISKIESLADFKPSAGTLAKLTSDNANPQNGVTYEEVMQAAGYMSPNDSLFSNDTFISDGHDEAEEDGYEKIKDDTLNFLYNNDPVFGYVKSFSLAHPRKDFEADKDRFAEKSKYDKMVLNIIVGEMARSRIRFYYSEENREDLIRLRSRSTLLLELDNPGNNINLWSLEVMPDNGNRHFPINLLFSKLLRNEINESLKISYVLTNENQFYFLRRRLEERPIPYRGEVSIILVDLEDMVVRDETYIANFNLDDHSQEFYIDSRHK